MKLFARTAFAAALLGSASFVICAFGRTIWGKWRSPRLNGVAGDAANGWKLLKN